MNRAELPTQPELAGCHEVPREVSEAVEDYRNATLCANRTLAELLTYEPGSAMAAHYADKLAQQVQIVVANAQWLRGKV